MKKSMLFAKSCLLVVAAATSTGLVPLVAAAQEYVAQGSAQTMEFESSIGRVEVDRDGIVAVSSPSPSSLRISGVGPGEAEISVYASDGRLLRQTSFTVPDPALHGGEVPPLASSGEQVVAVDVQFAAVSNSTLDALGFNFSRLSGDIQGAVVSPSSLNSASFGPSGLSLSASAPIQEAFNLFLSAPNRGVGAVLSALSNNGLSQLLAQPTLLARSGEQASFLAGGEVPIPVPGNSAAGGNGNTVTIEYKEFGVRLFVTPFVLEDERIVLRIAPEVSELDYGIGVQLQGYVVPGLRRRSAETTVELGAGQSYVIAGLSYSNSNMSEDRIPLLGDIPVIGALFRRERNSHEQQELIIVVTPRLVGPLEPHEVPQLPGVAAAESDEDVALADEGTTFGIVRN